MISLSADYAAAVLAAIVLTVLALHHDYQTSAEFVAAATEANTDHDEWSGSVYASILYGAQHLVGDVLIAGGLVSVFGGLGCVVASTRLLGPWAGLWLLAQTGFLLAATIPGPLILVVMCLLWAVYSSQQDGKGPWTALFLFMAYLLGEWSWPLALGVMFISQDRLIVLVSYAVGILAVGYVEGSILVLPEIMPSVIRSSLPASFGALVSNWVIGLALVALIWGSARGNKASRFLFLLAAVQVLSIAAGVGAAEHMLMAQVFVVLGIAAIETGPALLVFSLVLLGLRLPPVLDGTDRHREMVSLIRLTASSPEKALCTSYGFVRPTLSDGWIRPCWTLDRLPQSPSAIDPIHVRKAAIDQQARLFVTEDHAILHTYPWLQDFLEAPYPAGFRLEQQSGGWKVFSINP